MPDIILFIFFLATGINIFYWLYFYFLKTPEKSSLTEAKPISLIICAHNEYENLKRYLPSILSQEKVEYQVILVNDRSTDGTEEFLKTIQSPRLKVITISNVPSGWNPKKWALMHGAKQAKYSNLLFTDADCSPKSKEWAYLFSLALNKHDLVLGFSPHLKNSDLLNTFIRYETLHTAFSYLGFAQKNTPYMAVGRNFGTKKELYLNFSFKNVEHLTGGDDDLFVNQLPVNTKVQTLLNHKSHTITEAKKTLREYLHQKKRHLSVGAKYSGKSKFFLGTYNLSSLLYYLLGALLIVLHTSKSFVFGALLLRSIILFIIFDNNSRKLNDESLILKCFFLDFLYTLSLWVWGPIALLAKKVKWK